MAIENNYFLLSFVLLPLAALLLTLLTHRSRELRMSQPAFAALALHFALTVGFAGYWAWQGFPKINVQELALYESDSYKFLVDFYFDRVTAVYMLVGSFITMLIVRFSKYYMHLESGYKRFFATVLFFFAGYNVTVMAGNFETLFLGWEMIGISSFLLIAFYRERYLPVRNAVKVFSVYRIGDVGILMAMWASHHLWHENISFLKLDNYELVHEHLMAHSWVGIFISLSLLVAALVKSAQFPFSYWLPRAMEGPTPSSAIFYGSLSVHFGVFLLLRTSPFWEQQLSVRILIGFLGALTALIAFFITRVQSTVKTQIAYASITQIGIMFIEVALGWESLALFHFAGNAFLRTYQLLTSPSMVSYKIRDQFYHFAPKRRSGLGWLGKLENSLYMLSLREWNLEWLVNRTVFNPFKTFGHRLDFLTPSNVVRVFLPAYMAGLLAFFYQHLLPEQLLHVLPLVFTAMGLLLVFKAFSEKEHPSMALLSVLMNHFWVVLAVSFNESVDQSHFLFYLSGVVPAAALGLYCLKMLKREEPKWYGLHHYYGNAVDHPRLSWGFFVAILGLMGFPITPSFVGEDLIFSHIHSDQYALAFMSASGFVVSGIALVRIYARLFLGVNAKRTVGTCLKSA